MRDLRSLFTVRCSFFIVLLARRERSIATRNTSTTPRVAEADDCVEPRHVQRRLDGIGKSVERGVDGIDRIGGRAGVSQAAQPGAAEVGVGEEPVYVASPDAPARTDG